MRASTRSERIARTVGLGLLAGVLALPALGHLIAGPAPATGGAATFVGVVRDGHDGTPLSGARVALEGTGHATLTNLRGEYRLEVRGAGARGTEVTLAAGLDGYETARRTVRLGGDRVEADFVLHRTNPADPSTGTPGDSTAADPRTGLPGDEDGGKAGGESESAAGPQLRLREMVAPAPMSADASASGALVGRYDPNFHTESYARIEENRWLAPLDHPLSTFSIDVDRASYSNIRRFIRDGERPPIDAVRIEEMVNYFPYDYPDARGEHPFAVTAEVAPAPWRPEHRLVRIGIQGRRVDLESVPASNLVFLLDVSGSMRSPDKLPLLKKSLRLVVDELRPGDRVAIVVYAGAAGLVLESTPGSEKERILDAIQRLEAGGSTAGGAGIRLAYEVAARHRIEGGNNRVILATDGDFNIGPSSDAEMVRLIEEKRAQGTFLTVLGLGTGNLKDSKMEALADHGNGNYAYIDGLLEARKVLVTEMGGTLLTIAKDVKVQVEFNPERVQAYRLLGYENRMLAAEDFNDDTKDAGELGAGHSVTALYEVVPAGAPPVETGTVDPLRYRPTPDRTGGDESTGAGDALPGVADAGGDELLFVKLRYKRPEEDRSRLIERPVADAVEPGSADLRFAASVAAFGMILRDSEHAGDFALDDVARLARASVGDDPHGYRAEFVRLVEEAVGIESLVAGR